MKTKIFLAAGLLASAIGFSQNNAVYPSNASIPGANNVTIGHNSGQSLTSAGTNNVFSGFEAGKNTTTGKYNVFVGSLAGISNIGGSYNHGEHNTFLGASSGLSSSSGYQNVLVGSSAGKGLTTGGKNVIIGYRSGEIISTYIRNVIIGDMAGLEANGSYNTYIGELAGRRINGGHNTFIGNQAGNAATSGNYNVSIGKYAGNYLSGDKNVIAGAYAGAGSSSTHLGENNVLLGNSAGEFANGNRNVFIGNYAGNAQGGDDQFIIGNAADRKPLIYGQFWNTASQPQLKFNAHKVGIGFDSGEFGAFPSLTGIANASNYRLFVRGGIIATEVRVRATPWPDYVFADNYTLQPLKETEAYIAANKHLPNMPTAADVEANGIEIGNIVKLQQEKIEELTMHAIANEKTVDELKKQVEELKVQLQLLLNK